MSEREKVCVTLVDSEGFDLVPHEKLSDVIAWLKGVLDGVPVEHRDKVTVEFSATTSYDQGIPTLQIQYIRDETDDEMKTRLHHEKEQERAQAQHQERQERELLAKLTAKYKGE